MAYEKQEWKCGDTVTAEKLNHIEDGIANSGSGVLALTSVRTEEVGDCDYHYTGHTLQEVIDALQSGMPVTWTDDDVEPEAYMLTYLSNVEEVDAGSDEAEKGAYRIIGWGLYSNSNAEITPMNKRLYAQSLDGEVYYVVCPM